MNCKLEKSVRHRRCRHRRLGLVLVLNNSHGVYTARRRLVVNKDYRSLSHNLLYRNDHNTARCFLYIITIITTSIIITIIIIYISRLDNIVLLLCV